MAIAATNWSSRSRRALRRGSFARCEAFCGGERRSTSCLCARRRGSALKLGSSALGLHPFIGSAQGLGLDLSLAAHRFVKKTNTRPASGSTHSRVPLAPPCEIRSSTRARRASALACPSPAVVDGAPSSSSCLPETSPRVWSSPISAIVSGRNGSLRPSTTRVLQQRRARRARHVIERPEQSSARERRAGHVAQHDKPGQEGVDAHAVDRDDGPARAARIERRVRIPSGFWSRASRRTHGSPCR